MNSASTELIKCRVRELQEPENLFEGVRLPEHFALPDNILLFYHDFSAPAPIAHNRYTMVFPLADMHYYVDEQEFDIGEGDLLFIAPYSRRFLAPGSAGYQRFFVTFDLPAAQNYLPESCLNHFDETAAGYLEKIFDTYAHGKTEELSLTVYEFLSRLSPAKTRAGGKRLSREIASTLEFVNENLHTPLLNRSIAARVNMSTSNLARRFRREMSMPLHEYISAQRLEFACYYLQRTDMSIEEIALCCGFLSGSSFSHFFICRTGRSPLAYRKEYSH